VVIQLLLLHQITAFPESARDYFHAMLAMVKIITSLQSTHLKMIPFALINQDSMCSKQFLE